MPSWRIGALFVALNAQAALAADYYCPVSRKLAPDHEYTHEELPQAAFSVVVEESHPEGTRLSRCSYSRIEQKRTCDTYLADRSDTDPNTGIKKFYYFRGQFDMQIFPGLLFIENNGRGSIAFGVCKVQ